MTKRIPSGAPCFDRGHDHVVLAVHRLVEVEQPGEWHVSAWLCPVRRYVSVILEDGRPVDPARQTGGPLAEL